MGDTGAMALGGTIAAMAIFLKVELLLLLVGGVFVIEALSVMLQVITFKWWGRRVFLMAPLHHHFEMKEPPWSETKIMVRFWIVAGILCAAGFALFYKYYPPRSGRRLSRREGARLLRRRRVGQGRRGAARRARRRGRRRSTGRSGTRTTLGAARRRRRGREDAGRARRGRRCSRRRASAACPVWSEVELGFRLLPGSRFVGVTGTNGKTTTTRAARGDLPRRRAATSRSPGTSACRSPPCARPTGSSASSRRSSSRTCTCSRARSRCCSTSSRDHLDRYDSFEDYRDAKLRIFERARAKVVPRGLGLDGIEFAADDPLPAEPLLRGAHNRENAAAATAAARAAGIERRRDRRGAAHVPGRAAPARGRRRGGRRALRQRLEGDERRRRAAARSPRTRTSPCT